MQHEDASLQFMNQADSFLIHKIWHKETVDHIKHFKSTYGVALFELPFYTIAHQFAKFRGYDTRGYSLPYRLAILLSSNFYLIIGLYFLRKLLLQYFHKLTTELTLIIVVLGSNLFTYVTFDAGMSHAYTFFSVCIFLYGLDKWHKTDKLKYLLAASFSLGLIALLRPTNASFGIFLFVYNVNSISTLKNRIAFIFNRLPKYFLAFVIALIPLIPQLLYWKLVSGSWLFYSYGNEPFFWNDPKILEGLFSFRKGWLVYSPLMILSIFGLFSKNQSIKQNRLWVAFFLVINLYMIFSWWCWWYGGSFGQRSLIDFYPLLAIPIAASVEFLTSKNKLVKLFSLTIIAFLCFISLFQNYQFQNQILHHDAMTFKTYQSIFLKTKKPVDFYETIDIPDYELAIKGVR